MFPKLNIVLSLILLVFLAGYSSAADPEPGEPKPGDPAPTITASQWLRGEPIGEYEPGRVYVVDLWSTWCKPCIDSMPALHALEKKYGEDVTFIAMDVWEMEPARVPKFMEKSGEFMPAHVAMDSVPAGKEANEGLTAVAFLGTSENIALPRTYRIDNVGRIAWVGLPGKLEGNLTKLLATESAPGGTSSQ